jgi:hypothetical protein
VRDSHPSEYATSNGHLTNGANLAPISDETVRAAQKGCELPQERVRDAAENGAARRTPTVFNRKGTVSEPSHARASLVFDARDHANGAHVGTAVTRRPASTYHPLEAES